MKIPLRIKNHKVLIIWVLSIFLHQYVQAQSPEFFQKLTYAEKLLNAGQIQEAILELSNLKNQEIQSEDLSRLLGKAYYWSKDFPKTKEFFEHEIKANPEFLQLQLDYARIRYELQEWNAAQGLLEDLLPKLSDHPEINQKLAEINYWTGGSRKQSLDYLETILTQFPDNPSARELKAEIISQTASNLSFNSGYYSDSQPLRYRLIEGNFKTYLSSKFQPSFRIENRFYSENQRIILLELGNKVAFPRSNTSFQFMGGLVQNNQLDDLNITYLASLEQGFGNGFFGKATLAKEAYLYTLASLSQEISPRVALLSIERKSEKSWMGKLQADRRSFESNNRLHQISLWILIPILKSQGFGLSLGYAGTLADTDSVQFEAVSMPGPPSRPTFGQLIPGAYDPYFTPINQSIHGLLGKISWDFGKKHRIGITGNYGVFAEISNPNIYYFGPETPGNSPINRDNLTLLFNSETYHPIDLKFEYSSFLTKRTGLNFSYQYQRTIFFDSHFAGLTLHLTLY